jgi:NAD(P)-dependent dehydrogenase (short-subunit alcohol dehydrogenase family)
MYAVVTGGSRGIGRAIAEQLLDMGYSVVITAKENERLRKAAAEMSKKGMVEYFACDLSDIKEIDALCKFISDKKTALNVLVNNAGIWAEGDTSTAKMDVYDRMMNTNTRGAFYLTQKLLPMLKKAKNARIIITSSTHGLDASRADGRADATLYAMSKWGLRSWAKFLREEVRPFGIGVTVMYPGPVLTDEWEGHTYKKERFVRPADIGKAVRLVLSLSDNTAIDEITVNTIRELDEK